MARQKNDDGALRSSWKRRTRWPAGAAWPSCSRASRAASTSSASRASSRRSSANTFRARRCSASSAAARSAWAASGARPTAAIRRRQRRRWPAAAAAAAAAVEREDRRPRNPARPTYIPMPPSSCWCHSSTESVLGSLQFALTPALSSRRPLRVGCFQLRVALRSGACVSVVVFFCFWNRIPGPTWDWSRPVGGTLSPPNRMRSDRHPVRWSRLYPIGVVCRCWRHSFFVYTVLYRYTFTWNVSFVLCSIYLVAAPRPL